MSIAPLFSQGDHALQLRVAPAHCSPNDDDLQDQAFFYPVMTTNDNVGRWTLDILSARGKRVQRLTGTSLPALINWDGLDKKGQRAPDGEYKAKLSAVGKKKFHAEQTFRVDTVPPVASLSLSTNVFDRSFLDNSQLTLIPAFEDESPIDHWLLQVVDSGGRTAYVFWSTGSAREVQWNGTDQYTRVLVPQGNYRLILQAWDAAGNESLPAFVDLKVNVTPREMLERSLHRVQVNETALGLIIQLDAKFLFRKTRGGWDISEQGKELLREAAILANAYPSSSVKLDGYARGAKKAAQDRSQASIYAWKVYSHMTKVGSVKPSRMTVRGRGRSPMFDRRATGVPVLKNGVEVVIEGNGPW